MRADLAAARETWVSEAKTSRECAEREASDFLTYVDEDGAFADFHANRHTFISNLGKAGVPLTDAQKLARHSDPKLTSNIYTHLEVHDLAAAIGMLPDLPQERRPQKTALLAATGSAGTGRRDADDGKRLPRNGHNEAR